MNESTLKTTQVRVLRDVAKASEFTFIRHEDKFISGVPDLSVTGCGWTSWWEFKYANPTFDSTGAQDLMLAKLAMTGTAFYVIYSHVNGEQTTAVTTPRAYREMKAKKMEMSSVNTLMFARGPFDYKGVAQFILKVHRNGHRK
jgi:hypothetical protein